MRTRDILLLLLLLLAALLVRLPGQSWGLRGGAENHYHPDEDRLLRSAYEAYSGHRPSDFYPFGYSIQVGGVARLLGVEAEDFWGLLPAGRAVSLFYGVLTVARVWFLAIAVGVPKERCWLPAACYATAGLPVVYSHYATADTTLTFYFTATLLGAVKAYQSRGLSWVLVSAFFCGLAIATKLSFVLLVPLIVVCIRAKRWWVALPAALVTIAVAFQAICLFVYDLERFKKLLHVVRTDNVGVVQVHDYLGNPVVLALTGVVAFGLIAALLIALGSLAVLLKCRREGIAWSLPALVCLGVPTVIWVVSVCCMPIPFARHLLPVLPVLSLLAGLGISQSWGLWRPHVKTLIVLFVVGYQVAYLGSMEWQYVVDSREVMDQWLCSEGQDKQPLYRCWYSQLYDWQDGLARRGDLASAPYVLMHGAFYRRYMRSPINPFHRYPRPERIFHPRGLTKKVQRILKEDGYEEVKRVPVRYWTPELMFHKALLGTFPDFTGDTVLYAKQP